MTLSTSHPAIFCDSIYHADYSELFQKLLCLIFLFFHIYFCLFHRSNVACVTISICIVVYSLSSDTCYVLSFAIIMLNTSLHNPAVKDKPTVERFIDMNRGIKDGKDLPPDLLTVSQSKPSILYVHQELLLSAVTASGNSVAEAVSW